MCHCRDFQVKMKRINVMTMSSYNLLDLVWKQSFRGTILWNYVTRNLIELFENLQKFHNRSYFRIESSIVLHDFLFLFRFLVLLQIINKRIPYIATLPWCNTLLFLSKYLFQHSCLSDLMLGALVSSPKVFFKNISDKSWLVYFKIEKHAFWVTFRPLGSVRRGEAVLCNL